MHEHVTSAESIIIPALVYITATATTIPVISSTLGQLHLSRPYDDRRDSPWRAAAVSALLSGSMSAVEDTGVSPIEEEWPSSIAKRSSNVC